MTSLGIIAMKTDCRTFNSNSGVVSKPTNIDQDASELKKTSETRDFKVKMFETGLFLGVKVIQTGEKIDQAFESCGKRCIGIGLLVSSLLVILLVIALVLSLIRG